MQVCFLCQLVDAQRGKEEVGKGEELQQERQAT
jgi:hypothetical protein